MKLINPYLFVSAFSPLDIAGLRLWLTPDSLAGYAIDDLAGTWADLSGEGNDATSSGSARPTVKMSHLGFKYLRFDGSDDLMSGTLGISGSQPRTLFAVYRHRSGGGEKSAISNGDSDALPGNLINIGTSWLGFSSSNYGIRWPYADGLSSVLPSYTKYAVVIVKTDGNFRASYLNGTVMESGTVGATLNTTDIFYLGATKPNSFIYADVDLLETGEYDSMLDSDDVTALTDHLVTKYKILEVLADYEDGFTSTQGTAGWNYGTLTTPNTPSTFTNSSVSFASGAWTGTEDFDTPYFLSTQMHPGFDSNDSAAVRWTSDAARNVNIAVEAGTAGGTVQIRIYRNLTLLDEFLANLPFSSHAPRLLGPVFLGEDDFVLLEVDSLGSGGSDGTTAVLRITESTVPVSDTSPNGIAGTIPGLAAWHKTPILGAIDGSSIPDWPDASGNGLNFGGFYDPTYRSSVLNGFDVTEWDTDSIVCFLDSGVYPRTYAMVMKVTDLSVARTLYGSGGNGIQICINPSGYVEINRQFVTNIGTGNIVVSVGDWHVIVVRVTSTTWNIWIDGVDSGSGTHSVTLSSQDTLMGANGASNTEPFVGQIAESAIYTVGVSDSNIALLSSGLLDKFAI